LATNLSRQLSIRISGKDLDAAGCAHKSLVIADEGIADFQLPIADLKTGSLVLSKVHKLGNRQSAIGNRQ